jgi:superfamily II DNA or RNA helicase/diadenosine tetraphosphate (Ap4A) HIT family hydrolase
MRPWIAVSIFLQIPEALWVASNALAFAVRDRFPVSPGHTLVVTRRLVLDWFSATEKERGALMDLVDEVKQRLDEELRPDGYNVGFNAGEAAGQTVPHLHVHVIPRFRGDVGDPRGGVRHVIPGRGNYLRDGAATLATGGEEDPLARHVLPLFDRAADIAIVAAFVQGSGLDRIEAGLRGALQRGARVRIVTGDYLEITQASALELLLDWQAATGVAVQVGDEDEDAEGEGSRGRLEVRVVEVTPPRVPSFHPKSWRFEATGFGIAFVGSSNLSRLALDSGIEWNLRVDRGIDPVAYSRVCEAFDALWERARPLTAAWVGDYARRARRPLPVVLPGEWQVREPIEPPPEPHEVQREALAALREARAAGRRRAIVVLATGLGKTWLAAFDFSQLRDEIGRRPRLLFLAHRRELLRQAARTYRRQLLKGETTRVGWFDADDDDLGADLVFASVAKLARREHAARLRGQEFDYVVVDEVHHAAAQSYRRILDALDPGFLLGLTATPERADSADILGLFDDFVAYRADIGRGIGLGRLVPFHYFGIKDEIDYQNIPWRNRRFDPEVLARAAQTDSRMQTLWRSWAEHAGRRSMVFCCSIAHATYVRDWLRARGVRVAAVYAGEGTEDRERSLEALEQGDLDAICSVDMFNEGIDLPGIDRVIMLRPTESAVVLVQQLGRGLRASAGKSAVTVIDFVGNHRMFVERIRMLLSLGGTTGVEELQSFLSSDAGAELPAGCSVDLELEAKELLARLFRVSGTDEVERAYRELCLERGADDDPGLRPTAGELQRMGYLPGRVRERHGSWFGFVGAEKGLSPEEMRVVELASEFLRELEITEMTKSFKMITLEVLLEADALISGMSVPELAARSHAILRRSPELLADVPEEHRHAHMESGNAPRWVGYWRLNPIAAWTGPRKGRRVWFRIEEDRFGLDLAIEPELASAMSKLVRELVDYRLAQYRARRRAASHGFVCRVLSNQRDPILKLPARTGPSVPEGETDVRLASGEVWQFRFAREYCNVARPAGTSRNQLPDLLRSWFGPRAGRPGTRFEVRFAASPDGLWAEPLQGQVIELAARRRIAVYPDLRAAAGHAEHGSRTLEGDTVSLPLEDASPELFAVRVSGTSMDGGDHPLRDGDWAVMRVARGMPASAIEGRVALVEVLEHGLDSRFQVKRLRRDEHGWLLTSDNPDGPTFRASEETVPIARLERAVRPEDLAPAIGTVCREGELTPAFGLDSLEARSGCERQEGHLFAFIDQKGVLVEPDRLRLETVSPRPGETAFALARQPDDQGWRYLGIARQTDTAGVWALPVVDVTTWRAWGEGREVSRRLPEGALARAQLAVESALALPESRRWVGEGRRARILGPAARGGVRIDGGDGGFRERTVSLADIAWVIVAADHAAEEGGLLDEERVNRLRYLEGTPRASTRWIDTGWALALWNAVKGSVREPIAADAALHRVKRNDGTVIDASFRVERVGAALTVLFESRGGARGSDGQRNSDYADGLQILLGRLADARIDLDDVVVESRDTQILSREERRVSVPGQAYPIAIDDPAALASNLGAAQSRVGRTPGGRGAGNRTRRIRLFLSGAASVGSAADLVRFLAEGSRAGDHSPTDRP